MSYQRVLVDSAWGLGLVELQLLVVVLQLLELVLLRRLLIFVGFHLLVRFDNKVFAMHAC